MDIEINVLCPACKSHCDTDVSFAGEEPVAFKERLRLGKQRLTREGYKNINMDTEIACGCGCVFGILVQTESFVLKPA